jgi:hypothetical protein
MGDQKVEHVIPSKQETDRERTRLPGAGPRGVGPLRDFFFRLAHVPVRRRPKFLPAHDGAPSSSNEAELWIAVHDANTWNNPDHRSAHCRTDAGQDPAAPSRFLEQQQHAHTVVAKLQRSAEFGRPILFGFIESWRNGRGLGAAAFPCSERRTRGCSAIGKPD